MTQKLKGIYDVLCLNFGSQPSIFGFPYLQLVRNSVTRFG